ncbi:ribokinase [Sarracenia purpurea var. burkii]
MPLDTAGTGDTFTAAFAVAPVEGKSRKECLRFANMHGGLISSIFRLLTVFVTESVLILQRQLPLEGFGPSSISTRISLPCCSFYM